MQSRRLGFALDWLLSFMFRACISVQYIVVSVVILIPNSTKKKVAIPGAGPRVEKSKSLQKLE